MYIQGSKETLAGLGSTKFPWFPTAAYFLLMKSEKYHCKTL